jgi:hypoxanthine phosphoribosyltransferase
MKIDTTKYAVLLTVHDGGFIRVHVLEPLYKIIRLVYIKITL